MQHVAAHAAMDPNDLFPRLGERWMHARWLSDLQRAAGMCLLGGGEHRELQEELTGVWLSSQPKLPWMLLLADRAADFISLCRLEHERVWIERMFASISDHVRYSSLIAEYEVEGAVLEQRRRRIRNSLVHGNPATFPVVQSVPAARLLTTRTAEFAAMAGGQDAASYWRAEIAARAAATA